MSYSDEDEIPVEAGPFFSSNDEGKDPLALAADHQEAKKKRGRKCKGTPVKVGISQQQQPQKDAPPPPPPSNFNSEVEFMVEMNRSIMDIIKEAIHLFGMDPREYHPFYLRIYKYITIGQQRGYFKTLRDTHNCWMKYEQICADKMKKAANKKGAFKGVESPYATFIKTGKVIVNGKEISLKRNEEEIQKELIGLEKSAQDIVEQWKKKRRRTGDILSDFPTRMKFFQESKTMTFPADCVKMNELWNRFLNEFASPAEIEAKKLLEEKKKTEAAILAAEAKKKSLEKKKKTNADIVIVAAETANSVEKKKTSAGIVSVESGSASTPVLLSVEVPQLPSVKEELMDINYDAVVEMLAPDDDDDYDENDSQTAPDVDVEVNLSSRKSPKRVTKTKRSKKTKTTAKATKPTPHPSKKPKLDNEEDKSTPPRKSADKPPFKSVNKSRVKAVSTSTPRIVEPKGFAKLKVAQALKRLKRRAMESQVVQKQTKLEKMICSKQKRKSSLKKGGPQSQLTSVVKIEVDAPLSTTTPQDESQTKDGDKLESEPPQHDSSHPTNDKPKPAKKRNRNMEKERIWAKARSKVKVVCDECGELITKRNMKQHKLNVHTPGGRRGKCPICLQDFFDLWCHFQTNHMERMNMEEMEATTIVPPPLAEHDPRKERPIERTTKPIRNHKIEPNSNPEPSCYTCHFCGKSFNCAPSLDRHFYQVHGTDEKPFVCKDCPKRFKSKDTLDAHIKQVHLGDNARCDICGRVMQTGGKLWKHKVDVHGMFDLEAPPGVNVMQCYICGERLLRGMLQHMEKHHPESVESYKAEDREKLRVYKKQKQVLSEEAKQKAAERKREARRKWKEEGIGPAWIRKDPGNVPKQCPYCQMELPWGVRTGGNFWINHLKEEHQIDIAYKWICPKPNCGRRFKKKFELEGHLRSTHDEVDIMEVLKGIQFIKKSEAGEWNCSVCEHGLKFRDEVLIHFVMQHQQTIKKIRGKDDSKFAAITGQLIDCSHCEEKLATEQSYREHMEENHSDMCWKCPECEWIVISPTDLQEHFMLEHPDPILEWKRQKEEESRAEELQRAEWARKEANRKSKVPKTKTPKTPKVPKEASEIPKAPKVAKVSKKKMPKKKRGRPPVASRQKRKKPDSDSETSEDEAHSTTAKKRKVPRDSPTTSTRKSSRTSTVNRRSYVEDDE